ncbi:aminotransferase [Flammula alnicola]|nr:aminotransferase [Flammula alnicola]
MAIQNGDANTTTHTPAELDASKLIVNLAKELKPLPAPETLVFGETKTDHMLVINYDPIHGWSAPEVKPYAPLSFDPMASCFHYCPNVFEGMKAYLGPNGEARLFRPKKNMERLARSVARVALPPFNTDELLTLIEHFVKIESRWVPTLPDYSLYIRPTVIGTRPALGVAASDSACIYVIVTPAGPYFRGVPKGVSLLAVGESVRAWPGGTGGHKLGLNYAPGFLPQRLAAKQGYDQILGAMNFFVAVKVDDDTVDLITPPLDGTILPGVTRESTIALAQAHTAGEITIAGLAGLKFNVHERRVLEAFAVGTAVLVAAIGRIGWKGKDLVLPVHEGGLGPIAKGIKATIFDIQTGRKEFRDWSVPCL